MRCRLLNTLTFLSLLLFVAVVALWVRSSWWTDRVELLVYGGHRYIVESEAGALYVALYDAGVHGGFDRVLEINLESYSVAEGEGWNPSAAWHGIRMIRSGAFFGISFWLLAAFMLIVAWFLWRRTRSPGAPDQMRLRPSGDGDAKATNPTTT